MLKIIIFSLSLFVIVVNALRKRLLSSSTLWVFIYSIIFVAYPLLTDKVFNLETLIDIYAVSGIIMFILGLLIGNKITIKNSYSILKTGSLTPSFDAAYAIFWLVLAAFLLTVISVIGQDGIGSLFYGEITSKKLALDDSFNMTSFFIYLPQLLVPCVLVLWTAAKTHVEKSKRLVCFALYIAINVIFGFTRLFVICVLIIILFYNLRYTEIKKQIIILSGSVCLIFFLMILLNFIRNLGLGQILELKHMIDLGYMLESTDFGASYKYFNELLNFESPYINPIVWFKAFYAFIPREIWPFKPEPLSLQVLRYTNPGLAITGYTTAGNSILGEGYAIFGEVGIIMFPLIWGFLCSQLDKNYYHRIQKDTKTSVANIGYYLFTVFIIISAHRGDWSQYTVMILWLYVIPIFIISKFKIKL